MKKFENIILGLILGVIVISGGYYLFSSGKQNFNSTSTPTPAPASTPVLSNISSFGQISQADKTRMSEIIIGVMQNTTSVTQEIKNELKGIFKKYNTTDEEIDNFSVYGPAFALIYQQYFFIDALQAVSNGVPVKSDERLNTVKEALSKGLMTIERVKLNDDEMRLIANHQPVISSDGRQVIFTAETIQTTINNLGLVVDRLVLLFKK